MSDDNREKIASMTIGDALRKIEAGGEESLALLRMIEGNTKPAIVGKAVKNAMPIQQARKSIVSAVTAKPAVITQAAISRTRETSGRFVSKKPNEKIQPAQDQGKTLSEILKGGASKTWQEKKGDVKDIAGRAALGPMWDVGVQIKEAYQSTKEKSSQGTAGELRAWGVSKFGKKPGADKEAKAQATHAKAQAKHDKAEAESDKAEAKHDQHQAKADKAKAAVKAGAAGATVVNNGGGSGGGFLGNVASEVLGKKLGKGGLLKRAGSMGSTVASKGGSLLKGAGQLIGKSSMGAAVMEMAGGISLPLVAAAGAAAFGIQQMTKALMTGESDINNWFKKLTGLDAGKETQKDRDKAAKSEADNLANINKGRAPGTEIIKTADGQIVRADAKKNMENTAIELRKKGMSEEMITATLANVKKESGGISRTESMNYKNQSTDRMRTVFGSSTTGMSDEKLTALKNGPEDKLAEAMYGNGTKKGRDMGNTEAGDGYKFRGRGLVQLTGKGNYASMSQKLYGDDRLVRNPELANDSETAAKITAQYTSDRQKAAAKKLGFDPNTTNQAEANQISTQAVMGVGVDIKGKRAQEQLAIVDAASKSALVQGAVKATAGTSVAQVASTSAPTTTVTTPSTVTNSPKKKSVTTRPPVIQAAISSAPIQTAKTAITQGIPEYKRPPEPKSIQPEPPPNIEQLVAAVAQQQSQTAQQGKQQSSNSDKGPAAALPHIPTEFSDVQLTLMAYDRT